MAQVHFVKDGWMKVNYEVGDLVRLVSGDSPQRVLRIHVKNGQQYLCCQYLSGSHHKNQWGQPYHSRARVASDFVLLRGVNDPPEPQHHQQESIVTACVPQPSLYQTKGDSPLFGTFLARDSANRIVLEMKDGPDRVRAFADDEVELVVPYTVRLKGVAGSGVIDVQIPKGSVEKHDLLIVNNSLYIVTILDNKSANAAPLKRFRRVESKLVTLAGSASGSEDDEE